MATIDSENRVADAEASQAGTRSSTASHTPGPWAAFWNEENERLKLGSWRFTHDHHHALPLLRCSEGNSRARANARLIAAAPELLAALLNICANAEFGPDMGEAWQGTVDIYKVPIDDIDAARAAIAKATGATP